MEWLISSLSRYQPLGETDKIARFLNALNEGPHFWRHSRTRGIAQIQLGMGEDDRCNSP